MSQQELDKEVAQATGESLSTIRRRGFGLERPLEDLDGPVIFTMPQVVDWDAADRQRRRAA
jgi:hypothetical protein